MGGDDIHANDDPHQMSPGAHQDGEMVEDIRVHVSHDIKEESREECDQLVIDESPEKQETHANNITNTNEHIEYQTKLCTPQEPSRDQPEEVSETTYQEPYLLHMK